MKSLRLKLTLLISAIVAISVVVVGGIVVTTITNDLREESQMSILTQGEELDRLMKNTGDELDQMHETLYAGYDTLIKEQVDTVLSILQYYYDLSQSGMLTTEEAQEQAKDVIRAMRFGENGYFWIDNTDYILQVHPFSVATEGKSRKDTADPNGKLIIQEFIKTKNTGGGYTDYVWTKPEEDGLFPKRAYTGYFEPWEWVPGTGAYTDEIEAEFMTHVAETIASFQSQVMTLSSEYMVIAIQDDNTINHYTDPSQIGQVLTLTDAKTGGSIADLIKNSVGQYVNYSVEDPETGKVRMMLGYTFRNTVTQQYVMVAQNSEDVFASANKLQYTIIIVGLFVTLIAALLSYFAAGIVSKPIVKLKEISGLVSQGDLTVQSQFRGKDEVGQLSESFNAMIMNLRTMSQDSMQIAQSLDFSTENLSEMIDQSTKAIEQISVTIDEIAMGASAQAGETQVGVTKTDGLNNSSSEIKNSMEEMMSSVGEMRKMSDDGSDAMTDLSTKQQSNEASINKINDVMALLGEQMKTIDNFTAVIMNISQQTNLLSLNASIEAARAGEHGKGFAVVADEIRKLAEESNRSANEIKDVVARIQQDTEDAILVANEANEVTKEQNASVVNTQAIFNDLKSTISATVSKIEGVYGNIEQLVKDNQDVGYIMDNIHAITEGTAAASEEVAASVEEQNASMEEINSHIMTLTQEAKNLRDNMSQYKL